MQLASDLGELGGVFRGAEALGTGEEEGGQFLGFLVGGVLLDETGGELPVEQVEILVADQVLEEHETEMEGLYAREEFGDQGGVKAGQQDLVE